MKPNVGTLDKVLRLTLAALFAFLFLTDIATGVWGILSMTLAGSLVLTSGMSFCPLYTFLGYSSCPMEDQ